MRKLILLLCLLVSVVAEGRKIPESEAAAIASKFLNSAPTKQQSPKKVVRRVQGRNTIQEDFAPYYVYNADADNGFVIVSGDDRATRILGYSNTGVFDFNNLPPQLSDLLDQYAKQINAIPADAPTHASWNVEAQAELSVDGVLLETANWGQGAPYNSLCPVIDGVQCPTGCVATAMAIMMKYHNWPEEYDWDIMSNETVEENEIAHLMHDIGEKINTTYGVNESSAYVGPIPQYFYSEFSYDGDCQLITRINFTDEEYISYLKGELEQHRPVISFGSGDSGTHCFIFDGYDSNAMFHVNWGWDGAANGFYTLDALIPDSRDFSNSNGIVIGLKPAGSQSIDYSDYAYMDAGYGVDAVCLQSGGGLSMNCEDIVTNEWFTVTYNTLNIKSNIKYGFALIDPSNKIKEIAADSLNFIQVSENSFYPLFMIENKIRFHTEISENDRLAIVARSEDLSESWKLVRGTIEAPSIIKATGYNPPYATLIWDLDEELKVILRHGRSVDSYDVNTVPIKMLKGILLDVMVYSDKPGVVVLACDNVKYGRDINTCNWRYYENKNGIGGSINVKHNCYVISAHLVPNEECEENLIVNIETPGTLSNILNSDKLITGLTISGNLNAADFEFLRSEDERVIYIKRLNLANVSIYDEKGDLTNALPEYALSQYRSGGGFIQQLVLPNNLRGIGDNALSHLQSLRELDIPKNVTNIGKGTLLGNVMLRKIIVHNPEPFEIDPLAFDSVWFTPEHILLSVPIGAKSNYRNHTGLWSKFARIVEGNKRAESMSLKVYRNGKYENLTANDTVIYVHGQILSVSVEYSPKDAAEYFYTWSSNPEFAFPSFNMFFNDNEEYSFCIEDDFSEQEGHSTFFVESSSNLKQSFKVDSYPQLKNIAIIPDEITLKEKEESDLKVQTTPELDYVPINWTSSDETIAEVIDGKVIAHSPGSTIITANPYFSSDVTANCLVNVIPNLFVESLTISPDMKTCLLGENFTLAVTVLPENATDNSVLWFSSDESVATVDAEGNVSTHAVGEVVIMAIAADGSGVNATCLVTVNPIFVESLCIDPENWSGNEGDAFQIMADVLPEDATDKTIIWTSSDESVATVDAEGMVTVLKVGSCVITASTVDGSDITAECIITCATAIENLFADNMKVDVYTTGGVLLKRNYGKNELKTFTPGVYILRNDSGSKTVVIY